MARTKGIARPFPYRILDEDEEEQEATRRAEFLGLVQITYAAFIYAPNRNRVLARIGDEWTVCQYVGKPGTNAEVRRGMTFVIKAKGNDVTVDFTKQTYGFTWVAVQVPGRRT